MHAISALHEHAAAMHMSRPCLEAQQHHKPAQCGLAGTAPGGKRTGRERALLPRSAGHHVAGAATTQLPKRRCDAYECVCQPALTLRLILRGSLHLMWRSNSARKRLRTAASQAVCRDSCCTLEQCRIHALRTACHFCCGGLRLRHLSRRASRSDSISVSMSPAKEHHPEHRAE